MFSVSTDVGLLFQPLALKGLTLKNRLVYPPLVVNYAADDGTITDRTCAYYAARAKGGVGLVIVEASCVDPAGKGFANAVGVYDDRLMPGLRRLATVIHEGGGLASIQIWHAGRRALPSITGLESVAPSAVLGPDGNMPRALTVAEIAGLVRAFGQAARRARQAGFDMVEIHMGHSYLLNQFLSPLSNQRDDDYGGSFERRLRFPLEVVAEVRREVGSDFPVCARITADEYALGGLALADAQANARRLEQAGVDLISVSGGGGESPLMGPTGLKKGSAKTPPGYYTHLAAGIKEVVAVPVIAVGRLNDPANAAQVLASGHADLVAIGRGLFADPEWPNKVAAGRLGEIRRCTCCNGCLRHLYLQHPVACKQNKLLGLEYLC